jgi:YD repeat-containing protein
MLAKNVVVASGLSVLFFCLALSAVGQSCTTTEACSTYDQWNAACLPVPHLTAYDWHTVGTYTANASAKTTACAPATECTSCRVARTKYPIDLATGDTYFTATDVRIPGLGGGLTLERTWNSLPFGLGVGLFGAGWTSNFEESVSIGSDHYLKYLRGDGGVWSFGVNGWNNDGWPMYGVAGSASQVATITQINPPQQKGSWILTFQNGETRTFDMNTGKLLSITDRNGNTTVLGYDSSGRLLNVTDPAGRHISFSYQGFLVTGVTSNVGISLSYSYDSYGRLSRVTEPDNSTISYQYNDPNPNLITAILDSNGKVIESHTYNSCAQGVSSSRAGGVEALTIFYPLACHLGFSFVP